ncbi:uncharacterized protein DUF4231 [Halopolyspora algeriensis]|uniref:Uncharacterized protein DUF4231 n=1 Tax=Halopolyspora algeriensis TaxID=1500506 RepID=A0A368VVG9_9ACTN|nr:DUF4231 domain-containing protein [Halopolyspora algeriensis]RCW45843.1 uncharacterized protein DUF4231 [Halopolyspora algeriensis]TQM55258.1 uncharacterized protein DUF4231 [Halopolyspora algeriensis]
MSTTESSTTSALEHHDYPGLFQAADAASLRGQRSYLRAVRARLVLSVLAATSAAITITVGVADIAAVGTALFFVSALGIDMLVLRGKPNEAWYQGRALAESTKTLAWRYVSGGAPFPRSLDAAEADRMFIERLGALHRDLAAVRLLPTLSAVISERMRELRAASLPERRKVYLAERIQEQQSWYADKAVFHQRRADIYQALVLSFEIAGVAAALAKAFGAITFDLSGIIAATLAAFAAWSATRQHTTTANAYIVATHDLALARERLRHCTDEHQWANAVADAEAAVSREHSTWRSSHGGQAG